MDAPAHDQRHTRTVCPDVVSVARKLLDMCESGEVVGLAIATSHHDGCDGSVYEIGAGNIAVLVLGLERVKARLLDHGQEDEP